VQNLFTLSDGSALKITIAKYYTPSGVCIQGDGIIPDYVVELEQGQNFRIFDLELEEDCQLQKALEVMGEKLGR
jgi:carboxyl-terminal processing protease